MYTAVHIFKLIATTISFNSIVQLFVYHNRKNSINFDRSKQRTINIEPKNERERNNKTLNWIDMFGLSASEYAFFYLIIKI